MNTLTGASFKDDDANKKILVKLWGNSLNKLTPKQRKLVVEILSNLELTGSEATVPISYEAPVTISRLQMPLHKG